MPNFHAIDGGTRGPAPCREALFLMNQILRASLTLTLRFLVLLSERLGSILDIDAHSSAALVGMISTRERIFRGRDLDIFCELPSEAGRSFQGCGEGMGIWEAAAGRERWVGAGAEWGSSRSSSTRSREWLVGDIFELFFANHFMASSTRGGGRTGFSGRGGGGGGGGSRTLGLERGHVTHFGEFRSSTFRKNRELESWPGGGRFRLADAGRADHDDVLG